MQYKRKHEQVFADVTRAADGSLEWIRQEGETYLLVGITADGNKFRQECDNWMYASHINLYRARVWLKREGRRLLIKKVWN